MDTISCSKKVPIIITTCSLCINTPYSNSRIKVKTSTVFLACMCQYDTCAMHQNLGVEFDHSIGVIDHTMLCYL